MIKGRFFTFLVFFDKTLSNLKYAELLFLTKFFSVHSENSAVTKTRITDCADTEKKNQRMRMKKKKVDKSRNTEKIFFAETE
jgi:hypothetical protein